MKKRSTPFEFNDKHLEFVKANVVGKRNEELAELFNEHFGTDISLAQIRNFKKRHGLKSGLSGQFKKGCVSFNKGKKMSAEQYEKCKHTFFKKGHSTNTKDIGAERFDKCGYVLIKVDENGRKGWISKHKYLYEKEHGHIPTGHVVMFADGNKFNFDIDNLVLVSKAEMLFLNKHNLIYNDCELTKTGVLVARLMTKVNEKKKVLK